VDLTIVDANGEMLPMGTDFDEMTERSLTRHFEERVERGEILSASEQEALRNRRLLYHLMTRAGFTNFPNEWWHFDFGNKVWSCMRGGKAGPAVYGAAEPHFRWRPAGGRALPAKARPVEHRAHREPVAEVRTGRTFTTTKERKRAMVIGVPKEVKTLENRVALTPGAVQVLVRRGGHEVRVESGAGLGSGIHDHEYEEAGAKLVRAEETWEADLVVKVKEPVDWEYKYLREDLILYTYLHLAADRPLTERLMESKTTAIAYETVELPNGTLPLLTPMSEVAGRMATQVGAHFLEKPQNGRGVLLGGVPGVVPGTVMILGAGVVGNNAAKVAVGLGANVFMFDVDHRKLQYLDDVYQGRINTVSSNEANIRALLPRVDLLIGAVLLTGARAPRLVTRKMLSAMKEGSVIVDVSVDQGGCVETIEPTTHAEPTYVVEGVVHYGVANMPGAVPRTSTFALVNQTLPYCLRLAEKGLDALREDPSLAKGLNTYAGRLTYPAVGEAFDLPTVPVEEVLK
jgi:alanine dehydrogenase